MSKLKNLKEAIEEIQDGSIIAMGGNVLHRAPVAAVTELITQNKKRLNLVKTAGAHDVDLLCAAGSLDSVTFGFISYEPPYGLCNYFRKAVQSGAVKAKENACYTVIMGLRAAAFGLSFIPTKGLDGSDLIKANGFKKVSDPYTGHEYVALKAIKPDYTILHVQEADIDGNCKIIGPKYEDEIMARAAEKVIVTTEKIVDRSVFESNPDYADIPGNLVSAVVHLPKGSLPGSCAAFYEINDAAMKEFLAVSCDEELQEYIKSLRKLMGLTA